MVPRTKKPKRKQSNEVDRFILSISFCLSITVTALKNEYQWNDEQIGEFVGGFLALMGEAQDGRNTVTGTIKDCKELTGIDCLELINQVIRDSKVRK